MKGGKLLTAGSKMIWLSFGAMGFVLVDAFGCDDILALTGLSQNR